MSIMQLIKKNTILTFQKKNSMKPCNTTVYQKKIKPISLLCSNTKTTLSNIGKCAVPPPSCTERFLFEYSVFTGHLKYQMWIPEVTKLLIIICAEDYVYPTSQIIIWFKIQLARHILSLQSAI